MGDARIRLSPVRVVEVVHGFPVVDWRYHGLNIRSFKLVMVVSGFLYINLAFKVGFKLLI